MGRNVQVKMQTRHFGEIDVDESKVIRFEEGIPGFAECKRFILLQDEKDGGSDNEGIFWWLQSVDDGEITFVLLNLFAFYPDYNPLVEQEEIADLGEFDQEKFLVYNIAVIPDDIKQMSVNLKAPVVINTELKKGRQVVVSNEEYHIRHFIFDELKNSR